MNIVYCNEGFCLFCSLMYLYILPPNLMKTFFASFSALFEKFLELDIKLDK